MCLLLNVPGMTMGCTQFLVIGMPHRKEQELVAVIVEDHQLIEPKNTSQS